MSIRDELIVRHALVIAELAFSKQMLIIYKDSSIDMYNAYCKVIEDLTKELQQIEDSLKNPDVWK